MLFKDKKLMKTKEFFSTVQHLLGSTLDFPLRAFMRFLVRFLRSIFRIDLRFFGMKIIKQSL